MSNKSKGEQEFEYMTKSTEWKYPVPESEYRFHPVRRWRFDFAFPDRKIAVEIEGGQYTRGGHRGVGKSWLDMDKFNTAQTMGWIVLRVTPQMVGSDEFLSHIEDAFRLGS